MMKAGKQWGVVLGVTVGILFGLSLVGAYAATLDGSGYSIQLIDGDDDGTAVIFDVFDYGAGSDIYYRLNSGDWTLIEGWAGNVAELSGDGGDTLDFRLDVEDNGFLYSYDSDDATLIYSGEIPASYAQNPSRGDPFYRIVQIDWVGLGSFQLEILISQDVHDGFAPVPIPASAFLLGSGILGLIGIGCRRRSIKE